MTKIVDKMTTDLDLSVFNDGYKGVARVKEEKPKKTAAERMMEELREMPESLK
jgi:hypothetical protein